MNGDLIKQWVDIWLPSIRKTLNLSSDDLLFLRKYQKLGMSNPLNQTELFNRNNLVLSQFPQSHAIVFGAAKNLEKHIISLKDVLAEVSISPLIVAADGASFELLRQNIVPHVVFTDLDGGIDLILKLMGYSVWLFVLLHPDNLKLIDSLYHEFLSYSKVIFCTQDRPSFGFVNSFGFTDGDRAVSYFAYSGYLTLPLGFDLSHEPGWSSIRKKEVTEEFLNRKLKKLAIARDIIDEVSITGFVYTIDKKLNPGTLLLGNSLKEKLLAFFHSSA